MFHIAQVGSWSELPIDPEKIEALTKKEREQQLALWEFIYTEHSHLRQLEIVINVRVCEFIHSNLCTVVPSVWAGAPLGTWR